LSRARIRIPAAKPRIECWSWWLAIPGKETNGVLEMFRKISFGVIAISFMAIAIYSVLNPLDSSSNIGEFYSSNPDAGPDAELWGRGGSYFRWQSSQPENSQLPELNIFTVLSAIWITPPSL